jgi:hypothetical protein
MLYRRDEIVNRHNQAIYYWSKQPGNTELDKYKNFKLAMGVVNSNDSVYIIPDNQNNDITCIVDNDQGPNGHILVCFNHIGETILNTDDCYTNDKYSVEESLRDYNLI